MFGYIRPAEDRLDKEERERFRAAYCGLCHTLGERYGLAARFLLNYDFAFLTVLLSSGDAPPCEERRCIAHPCKKHCTMLKTEAAELAADRSVILAWWQLQDHIADKGFVKSIKYRIAASILKPSYRKARRYASDFEESVQQHLRALAAAERACCASIDEAAEPFAALMADIAGCVREERKSRILRELFYHLGRWIYLVDAVDDFERDSAEGCYNPLRFRYEIFSDTLSEEAKQELAFTLDLSIRHMAGAYALCDYGAWTPVLDSIFYESLYGIGKAVLDGSYRKPPHRLPAIQRKQEERP